jgi:hypothetical protein
MDMTNLTAILRYPRRGGFIRIPVVVAVGIVPVILSAA